MIGCYNSKLADGKKRNRVRQCMGTHTHLASWFVWVLALCCTSQSALGAHIMSGSGVTTLGVDGNCTVSNPSKFRLDIVYKWDTDDGGGEDRVFQYHIDGAGTIIESFDGTHTVGYSGAFRGQTNTPFNQGPTFRHVIIDAAPATVLQPLGATYVPLSSGTVLTDVSYNPTLLDPDCPHPNPDTTAPTVQILNAPSNLGDTKAFNVTVKFSEAVTGFTLGDISVGNGSASGLNGSGDTYTADITPDSGGDVSISVPANAAIDNAGNGNVASKTLTIDCGFGCNRQETIEQTQQTIMNYLGSSQSRRNGQTLNLAGHLDGNSESLGFNGSGGLPIGINYNNQIGGSQGSFSFNLRDFNKFYHSAAKDDSTSGNRVIDPLGDDGNVWVKGYWSRTDDNRGNIGERTNYSDLYVGTDYRVNDSLLVGVLSYIDQTDARSSTLNSKIKGHGWMIGPYMVKRFNDKLTFDALVTGGKSFNQINLKDKGWDNFDTQRLRLESNLTGSYDKDNLHIAPNFGLTYDEEKQKAYTDSNGFLIPGQTSTLGSVNFGPTFTYTLQGSSGSVIKPQFGINGVWDFKGPDITGSNGIATGTEGLRGRANVGLAVQNKNGISWQGSYTYDGIGVSNYRSHTGGLSLNIPLKGKHVPKGTALQGSYTRGVGVSPVNRDQSRGSTVSLTVPLP